MYYITIITKYIGCFGVEDVDGSSIQNLSKECKLPS